MGNMRFKVGDRVRIKSLDWYNENKTTEGCLVCGESHINPEMICMLGKTVTISSVEGNHYRIKEYAWNWTDEMIEGLVEEETKHNIIEEAKNYWDSIKAAWICPEGYIFKDENGNEILTSKIILEKKKKEYPKTYKECCYVLGFENTELVFEDDYRDINPPKEQWKRLGLMNQLNKLLICRDAYWKIAGEEMGLGKPWELSIGTPIYYIYYNRTVGTIKNDYADDIQGNIILAFPTAEMRDAFYEAFREEIEICKELL